MKIELMDRARLEVVNRKGFKYALQDAEKDYILAVLLKILYDSPLAGALVFKGGTALYHCYLDQVRFSRDLDFTVTTGITPEALSKVFSEYSWLKVKEIVTKKHGFDLSLQYTAVLSQADTILLNANTNQKVLLPTRSLPYKNSYYVEVKCPVMDEREIFTEKIRTINERTKPRDYYDLVMLKRHKDIDIEFCLELLKQKETHKKISKTSLLENMKVVLPGYDREMKELYYGEEVAKEEVETLVTKIAGML